ncbi:hypothetical protein F511_38991 [Dorcoceras hygrometricum]|uniref:Uncharacterized protein n=1 Tax=Dorcoceras hygrometricum TaxID=472368 RepID=A0A2Z7D2I9_9LAMI|nr:hypothetical protein F511_38991 [Dorcoceras hygrometricum]
MRNNSREAAPSDRPSMHGQRACTAHVHACAYIEIVYILQQKPAVALNKNQQQPTDVAFAKEHQNDAASTNQNDAVALQHLTTDFFPNNQQMVALNNSNGVVKDTSPLLPTVDQKRYTQNAAFQLIKTTSPLISDWFLKPTAGHSAGTIPHNATADSATIQQSTPKSLTNTCRFLVNPHIRATAASRYLFKRYY